MNYTVIDQMCTALRNQIRDYVQPGDARSLSQMLGLVQIAAEELEDPTGDEIAVTDADFDLVAGGGMSSVVLVVNYYRAKASAAPEDRQLRQAMERIRSAILSDERLGLGCMIEGLTAEKGIFPGAAEGEAITGGQFLINYHIPQGTFTQEPRG